MTRQARFALIICSCLLAAAFAAKAQICLFIGAYYDQIPVTAEKNRKAMRWYRLAAEYGNRQAASIIGILYLNGTPASRDVAAGIHWLTFAADAGDDEAEALLGVVYCLGYGVSADTDRANQYWRSSASHGNLFAARNIATARCFPSGSRTDPPEKSL